MLSYLQQIVWVSVVTVTVLSILKVQISREISAEESHLPTPNACLPNAPGLWFNWYSILRYIDGKALIKFTKSIRGLGIQHKSRVVIFNVDYFF